MLWNVRNRVGVTLVELLVVMSILVALTALALMLLPSFANNTATTAGTAEVQATLRNAQAMAASARLPRGVRFIPQNGGSYVCSEMQYLEVPPIMLPDTQVLSSGSPQFGGQPDSARPYVQFTYTTTPAGSKSFAGGTTTSRQCIIYNVTAPEQTAQIAAGGTLVLPTLGFWSRIVGAPPQPITTFPITVTLSVYPDSMLGAGTSYETYYFGIYGPPVPLLGEPVVVLPKNIGVDLQLSSPGPPGGAPGQPYDVVFASNGQTITTGAAVANTGIYLWVRDYTKTSIAGTSGAALLSAFQTAGDQQIVGIRNGYVGTAPAAWPDAAGGTYSSAYPYGALSIAKTNLK